MTKREIYKSHEPIAYYSGLGGLEVRHIGCGINDYLYLIADAWNGKKSYHKCKIHYGRNSNYITLHGCRYKLSDFMRV